MGFRFLLPVLAGFLGFASGTITLMADDFSVAVLEHPDRWTKAAVGAKRLLQESGAQVVPLDATRAPQDLGVDAIVLGSFVNNAPPYQAYVAKHAQALRDYVADGGVVLLMTQSDQYGDRVPWLPESLLATRGDEDLAAVMTVAEEGPKHPLLSGWAPAPEKQLEYATLGGNQLNWESLQRWDGFRVLMASKLGPERPALLEAAFGKGRIIVSSLWLDKVIDADGRLVVPEASYATSKAFFAAFVRYTKAVQAGTAPPVVPTPTPPERPTGPLLGHVGLQEAFVWYRPAEPGALTLTVWDAAQPTATRQTINREALPEHDRCITWHVEGLTAETTYRYEVRKTGAEGELLAGGPDCQFRTAAPADKPVQVALAFGSCASSTEHFEVWQRIENEGIDGLVLLGDTPYINSSDLRVNRDRHREFLQMPTLAALGRDTPIWGTWDDHDFGGNDTDGNVPNKEVIRQVFTEYRAHRHFGDGREGIYTRFRRGPIEVFLLDARYFAQAEASPVDPDKPTCLGKTQWKWLKEGLQASSADFKIIASGQIWDDKTNREKDDWHTYAHEREALYDFIAEKKIRGVILMGGDIHASRVLRYEDRVAYPLWQFIVSPLHDSTIKALNVPHPDLVWGVAEPNVFLRVVADNRGPQATLVATWIQMDGSRLFEVRLTADQLTPK